jgi:hypothetical protein
MVLRKSGYAKTLEIMGRKDAKVIGFRVDGEASSRLGEAAERAGISIHEWAKKIVLRELDSENLIPKLDLKSDAIQGELLEIRRDLAVMTEALLVSGGKATSEQAAKFVKANLKSNA